MSPCDKASELIDALAQVSTSSAISRSLRMHLERCSKCRAILGAHNIDSNSLVKPRETPLGPSRRFPNEGYTGVLERVLPDILDENSRMEIQRATAPRLLAELLELSSAQRKLFVRNSGRYQVWGLAEEALGEARRGWTEDPRRSEDLALLAVAITGTLPATGFPQSLLQDLKAEAWSVVANCRRIRTDYKEAERAFRKAELHLAEGSGDRLERARLLDLKASFFVDIGYYESAELLLVEAIAEYAAIGERHLEGRALMKRARLLDYSGRIEETIPVLQEAADLVDVVAEPTLTFLLRKNLMRCLLECGRVAEAQNLLPEVRELARKHANRLERHRLLWTEGMLRKKLGQIDLATTVLKNVRYGFMDADIGYDVALVSLDLAALYLESGRTEEAQALATESIPLFTSRGIHREALAAWSLFRDAAERDALTVGLVQEVASRIRNAQGLPASAGDLP